MIDPYRLSRLAQRLRVALAVAVVTWVADDVLPAIARRQRRRRSEAEARAWRVN